MAFGAVLVVGGAVAFAVYVVADRSTAPVVGEQISLDELADRVANNQYGSLYDSQVPAEARDNVGPLAVRGYGIGGSVYVSQVPAQARDNVASCVPVTHEVGSAFDSQVPAAASGAVACVIVRSGPGGYLYDSQVPAEARTE